MIFGHGLMAERRFVLSIADALADRGYAGIAIDFPYHGSRTHCAWNGPACFPNPLSTSGEMICPNPCKSGSACGSDGKCYDGSGHVTDLSTWPLIPLQQASGAAFVDVGNIPATRDHFFQAITDLGALSRAIRQGDWQTAVGYRLKRDAIYYAGQSLGGIIGGTYTALDRYVQRAVLNVPGANLVPLFSDSLLFSGHIDALLEREKIEKESGDHHAFLNLAHWFADSIDPANVAQYLQKQPLPGVGLPEGRRVMIQMATLDFIVPNPYTKYLQNVAEVPRVDYVAEHAFIVIPVEPAYLRGVNEMASFIAGSFNP
jgi:hypothetical protein